MRGEVWECGQEGSPCFSLLRRCSEDISGRFASGQDAALRGLEVETLEASLKDVKKRRGTRSGIAERIHAEWAGSRRRPELCDEEHVALLTNGALLVLVGWFGGAFRGACA